MKEYYLVDAMDAKEPEATESVSMFIDVVKACRV